MTSQTCPNKIDNDNAFDPLGDDGMGGDEYQSYHGCGIPGCDCASYDVNGDPINYDDEPEDDD